LIVLERGTDQSPAQIVPSQGVAPKLDPHQAIGAEFRYVLWRWATGMALGGGALSFVSPRRKEEAALAQRPLSFSFVTEALRPQRKAAAVLRSAPACRS